MLLMAALFMGQKAAADSKITHGGQTYTIFDSEDYYTATAGSETSTAYTYEYLVDNVIVPEWTQQPFRYTYWMTDDDYGFPDKFIEFYSAEPIVFKGYRLRTGINTKNKPNRRPKSWTLKGKKHVDDAEWTVLAKVTGDTQLPKENEKTVDYWLTDNTAPYQYFRFEVTAIQGLEEIKVSSNISYNRWRMELSELQIIGNSYSADNDLDYATIEGLQHYYSWTDSDITPTFTVKDMSDHELAEGPHYTVSYSYNGNSITTPNATGNYTLTITGTGSYFGQQTASFKVVQTLSGTGEENDPYIIADANDWYVFGKYIKETGANMSDKCYKLADDFDNSNEPITEMIATDGAMPFCGILDGNGRTLHIALKANSEAGCAPFGYLKNATIKNLTVAGFAATSSKFGASIAVHNQSENFSTTNITDCYSTVTIASSIDGDGTNGGFVGVNHGTLKFTRCAFLGRMLGKTATSNGGFVGWNDDNCSLTFTQCVFDPGKVNMNSSNSKTFSRYNTTSPIFDGEKSYFTYAEWGTNQGTQAIALTTAPANLGNEGEANGKMTLYDNGLLCDGKYYVAGVGFYDTASNAALLSDTDGKQVNVTLTGQTLFKDGVWNTLCLPFDLDMDRVQNFVGSEGMLMELDTDNKWTMENGQWRMDENGESQTGFDPVTGTLYLFFKSADNIKAGTPYIIKWSSGINITNREFLSVIIDNSDDALIRHTVEANNTGLRPVQFIGTYSPVELPIDDKSNLLLGIDSEKKSTLFYPKDGNNGDTDNPKYFVNAFRAYFHVDLSDGANIGAFVLNIDDEAGNATGILRMENEEWKMENSAGAWYTIEGVKLTAKPTRKGLYIRHRKKVMIK